MVELDMDIEKLEKELEKFNCPIEPSKGFVCAARMSTLTGRNMNTILSFLREKCKDVKFETILKNRHKTRYYYLPEILEKMKEYDF